MNNSKTNLLPLQAFLVCLPLSKKMARELEDLGLPEHFENASRTAAKRGRHVEMAEERGVDPYRFNRRDDQGKPIPDSGTPVFTSGGTKGAYEYEAVNLCRIEDDLLEAGYELTGLRIKKKQTGNGFKPILVLRYEPVEEDSPDRPTRMSDWGGGIGDMLVAASSRWFSNLFGFRNPNETVTLNASGGLQQPEVDKLATASGKIRITRMDTLGHFSHEKPAADHVSHHQVANAS